MQDDSFFSQLVSFFHPFTSKKALLVLAVVALVVFFNALSGGFILDDKTYILLNADVRHLQLLKLFGPNSFNGYGLYRPLDAVYFAMLFHLFGIHTFFYHLIPIAMHIVNAYLVYVLFCFFLRKRIAFPLALIFLVHPMQVESVIYINGTASPLSFSFGMAAFLVAFRQKLSIRHYVLIAFFFLLALLVKESVVQFALMLVVFFLLYRKGKHLLAYTSVAIATVLYALIRVASGVSLFSDTQVVPIQQINLAQRFLSMPAVLWYYIGTFFLPLRLVVDQQWVITAATTNAFYLPLLADIGALALVVVLLVALRKKAAFKSLLFFFIWFGIGIGLYLQLMPLDATVADRWMYFPIIGVIGMCGVVIQELLATNRRYTIPIYILLALAISALGLRTIVRNANWSDAFALYLHDSAISTNYDVENNLGNEYLDRRDYKNAAKHFANSIEFYPTEVNVSNLAHAYWGLGDVANAKQTYQKVLVSQIIFPKVHPAIALDAYEALSWISMMQDKPSIAEATVQGALEKYPQAGSLWADLAMVLYKEGKQQDALAAATKAKQFEPDSATAQLYDQIVGKKDVPYPSAVAK